MRLPANFLVVRIRLPEWRRGLFFALPLFVLEDALESAAVLVRAGLWIGRRLGVGTPEPGFLSRIVGIRAGVSNAGDDDEYDADDPGPGRRRRRGSGRGRSGWEWKLLEEIAYLPAALIGALRSCGRFTLADVRDGCTRVSVRVM